MKFSSLLFWFFTPCAISHPHAALTDEQIELAKVFFLQFKADPTDPDVFSNNPGLLESLRTIFGSIFGDSELTHIFMDIFANDDDEVSFTSDDHNGGAKDRGDGDGADPPAELLFQTMPSDFPSSMPSDVPSSMPSDIPSSMPSDVPSSTPLEWVDSTDPSIHKVPKDFRACPSQVGISSDLKRAPKLTIMYGYRLELKEDADMKEVIASVEEKVTTHLLESLCGAEKALAVSSDPKDIPGAWCESDDSTEAESCFYIAGRTTLLVSEDVAKDSAPLYCLGLESIRQKLSDPSEFVALDGVVSISSTVGVDGLVPDYCQTTGTGADATIEENSSPSIVGNGNNDIIPSTYNGDLRWTGFMVMAIAIFALFLFGVIIGVHRGRLARRRPSPMRMMQSRSRMDLEEYNLSPRAEEDSASAFSEVWQAEESSTVIAVMPDEH